MACAPASVRPCPCHVLGMGELNCSSHASRFLFAPTVSAILLPPRQIWKVGSALTPNICATSCAQSKSIASTASQRVRNWTPSPSETVPWASTQVAGPEHQCHRLSGSEPYRACISSQEHHGFDELGACSFIYWSHHAAGAAPFGAKVYHNLRPAASTAEWTLLSVVLYTVWSGLYSGAGGAA